MSRGGVMRLGGEADGAPVGFWTRERRDGVRQEVAESRKAAAWSGLVRSGGEKRSERWERRRDHVELALGELLQKKFRRRVRDVRPDKGERIGEVSGLGSSSPRRN